MHYVLKNQSLTGNAYDSCNLNPIGLLPVDAL
jgi:hypothetical protein